MPLLMWMMAHRYYTHGNTSSETVPDIHITATSWWKQTNL